MQPLAIDALFFVKTQIYELLLLPALFYQPVYLITFDLLVLNNLLYLVLLSSLTLHVIVFLRDCC